MKFLRGLTLSLVTVGFSLSLAVSIAAQQFSSTSANASVSGPRSGITTLYSNDPVARTLCLLDGKEGGVIQNGRVTNRCSQIEFEGYVAGSMSVGIEGGQTGRIIDLGSMSELRKQYGYEETVGNGQGFASITLKDGSLFILKDRKSGSLQALNAAELFVRKDSVDSAEAKVGHIYLARITGTRDPGLNLLVKLLVLSAKPGESVTFRWELL